MNIFDDTTIDLYSSLFSIFANLSFVTFPALISNETAIVKINIDCKILLFVLGYALVTKSNILLKSASACFKILKFLVPLFSKVEIIKDVFVFKNLVKSAYFSYLIKIPLII